MGDIVREMGVYRGVNFGTKMCSGENVISLLLLWATKNGERGEGEDSLRLYESWMV